jgi:hypothetical protein
LGGYVIGRSAEKVLPSVINTLRKDKWNTYYKWHKS